MQLTGRDEQTYGNHMSLSKSRAQRVALDLQENLVLPVLAIESDGRVVTFFFHADDGIRDFPVTGVQTCDLPISPMPDCRPFASKSIERGRRWAQLPCIG